MCWHAAELPVVQGEFLIELAVDIKPPKDWHKVCSTKKVHRWRPPVVTAAVAERARACERLQVPCHFFPLPCVSLEPVFLFSSGQCAPRCCCPGGLGGLCVNGGSACCLSVAFLSMATASTI